MSKRRIVEITIVKPQWNYTIRKSDPKNVFFARVLRNYGQ